MGYFYRLFYVFFLLLALSTTRVDAADDSWKLIAQSDVIAQGVLSAPLEEIADIRKSEKHRYISIPVHVTSCIKGTCGKVFSFRHYTQDVPYAPSLQSIVDANGKESVFFLVIVEDRDVAGAYFAQGNGSALRNSSMDELSRVSSEVAAQAAALDAFPKKYRNCADPNHRKVKELIDSFTNHRKEMDAFRELENLGESAVPSMIVLMDDRRDLPIKHISLENKSPNAFEATRHYGPQKVVDAIDALLSQISGERFGRIENGGSEQERRAAVNGWRIFLDHLQASHPNK